MNLPRVTAIVTKDLAKLRANRMAMIPMIVVPIVLCVVVPAVFDTTATQIVYVFMNYLFVSMFMLVPIMVSSIISANSVVGEKERHTLETLLYTPMTNQEFVLAKELSAFVPALVVTVRSLLWIPAILIASSAVSLLAKSFMETQQMSAVVVVRDRRGAPCEGRPALRPRDDCEDAVVRSPCRPILTIFVSVRGRHGRRGHR